MCERLILLIIYIQNNLSLRVIKCIQKPTLSIQIWPKNQFRLFYFENKCTYIKEIKNITKHDAVYRCNVSLTIQEKVLLDSLVWISTLRCSCNERPLIVKIIKHVVQSSNLPVFLSFICRYISMVPTTLVISRSSRRNFNIIHVIN